MSKCLPELLDPRRAVAIGAEFRGDLPLAAFARLGGLIEPDRDGSRQVSYALRFERDEQQRDLVIGTLCTTLRLCCQRCAQPYDLKVQTRFALAIVTGLDAARLLPDQYDPLLLETPLIRPRDLIEDELILAVPAVPRHAEGDCQPPSWSDSRSDLRSDQGSDRGSHDQVPPRPADERQRPNPFAALAALRTGTPNSDSDSAPVPDPGP